MALRFCDSFDHYPTADLSYKYEERGSNGESLTTGRFGNGLVVQNTNWSVTKWLTSHATWIIGFAVKFDANTSVGQGGNPWIRIKDDTTDQVTVYMDTARRLCFTRNGTYLGVASTFFPAGVWMHMEIKVTIDNSAGSIYMRVNGNNETITFASGTQTTQDTQYTANATANRFQIVGASTAGAMTIDDLYICDGSGATNNDFLGDVRVQAIMPSGAGGTTQWTPSAGNNWDCVNDVVALADTDYVSETTASEKDTYAFGNVTPTSGTVLGVQVLVGARKDDAGSRSIAPVYGNGTPASDVDGTTVSVGDSYTFYREVAEQDPVAAAAWTISSVNGAEFGVKLVS